MRLLNVRDLRMEEFFGESTPPYAILSHTWGDDEVTFQDRLLITTGTRYAKIRGACAKAFSDGLKYIWIDTICIDKMSSAELSEAINSMFAWYQDARVCYTYLVDVPDDATSLDIHGKLVVSGSFRQSRWFTRGWTLQELLAPAEVTFYSTNWKRLGNKADLSGFLWQITGIPERYLTGQTPIYVASMSQRMSWMSKRVTTRVEDLAYSLLGIFDIYMPLIYGEGRRAFLRLQEEILKSTDDQSIFCWEWDRSHVQESWASILAPCPAVFTKAAEYVPTYWDDQAEVVPYDISNAGLPIRLPLVPTANPRLVLAVLEVRLEWRLEWMLSLGDTRPPPPTRHQLCIPLQKDRVYRRLPFPTRPFLLDMAMITTKENIHVMSWERSPELRRGYITAREEQAKLFTWTPFKVGFLFAFSSQPTKLELAYCTHPARILEDRGVVHFLENRGVVHFLDGPWTASYLNALKATDVFAAMVVNLTFGDENSFIFLAMRRNAALAADTSSPMNFYTQVLPRERCAGEADIRAVVVEMEEAIGPGHEDVDFLTDGVVRVALGDRVPSGSDERFVKLVQVVYRDADERKILLERAELMGPLIAG